MPSKQTTAPASEPLTLSELKQYLRIENNVEDALLNLIISAVRDRAERNSGMQLLGATFTHSINEFRDVEFPKHPTNSVSSVSYVDEAGQTQTLSTSLYRFDNISEPAQLKFIVGELPKLNQDVDYPISIVYTAGYESADDVPAMMKAAMMLDAGTLYEHRNELIYGSLAELPRTALDMYREYRVSLW